MGIEEMHVTFRELGQQMGMQTTRAILSEDIDICINTAIINKVREVIATHVGRVNYTDKIARQGEAISPINALRTLYSSGTIEEGSIQGEGTEVNPYTCNINDESVLLYTGFRVSYNGNTLYDCRIIEAEKLGQTLRDFCNRAAKDAPIVVVYGDENSIQCNFYTGRSINTPKPKLVNYLYIKTPAKVCYDEDNPENNINCDLPIYLHSEIVIDAVKLYLASIGAIPNDKNRNVTT